MQAAALIRVPRLRTPALTHSTPDACHARLCPDSVDVILDSAARPMLLEVNSNPSLRLDFEREVSPGVMESEPSPVDEAVKDIAVGGSFEILLGCAPGGGNGGAAGSSGDEDGDGSDDGGEGEGDYGGGGGAASSSGGGGDRSGGGHAAGGGSDTKSEDDLDLSSLSDTASASAAASSVFKASGSTYASWYDPVLPDAAAAAALGLGDVDDLAVFSDVYRVFRSLSAAVRGSGTIGSSAFVRFLRRCGFVTSVTSGAAARGSSTATVGPAMSSSVLEWSALGLAVSLTTADADLLYRKACVGPDDDVGSRGQLDSRAFARAVVLLAKRARAGAGAGGDGRFDARGGAAASSAGDDVDDVADSGGGTFHDDDLSLADDVRAIVRRMQAATAAAAAEE